MNEKIFLHNRNNIENNSRPYNALLSNLCQIIQNELLNEIDQKFSSQIDTILNVIDLAIMPWEKITANLKYQTCVRKLGPRKRNGSTISVRPTIYVCQ